jgi:hypothetical protein
VAGGVVAGQFRRVEPGGFCLHREERVVAAQALPH